MSRRGSRIEKTVATRWASSGGGKLGLPRSNHPHKRVSNPYKSPSYVSSKAWAAVSTRGSRWVNRMGKSRFFCFPLLLVPCFAFFLCVFFNLPLLSSSYYLQMKSVVFSMTIFVESGPRVVANKQIRNKTRSIKKGELGCD